MPQIAIGAVGTAIAGKIAGLTLAKIALSVALTVAAGLANQLLAPKPKSQKRQLQDQTFTVREAAAPHRVIYGETMVPGTIIYMSATDNNAFLHIVCALAGHRIDSVTGLYFGNEEVTLDGSGDATGDYAGLVRAKFKTGTTTQTAFADLVTESGGEWTANHTGSGRALAYVRLRFDADTFPNGIPNLRFLVKGKPVYDPRVSGHDATDPDTWEWSDNAALCLSDYMCSEYGLALDYAARIDDTALIAAANICDETVALASGGSETRYTCNGTFRSDSLPRDIIPSMAQAMASRPPVWSQGKYTILAGAFVSPTVTLDDGDFRTMRVQSLVSRRENFNAVRGKFVDPAGDYQETDYPPIESAAFKALDNDEEIFAQIDLPFTQSSSMAQRIAKVSLFKVRQALVVSVTTSLAGYQVRPGDTVMLTHARWGWSAKTFDVERVGMVIDGDTMSVTMDLREIDASVFDWSLSEEQAMDPSPNTSLPNPFVVANPTALAVTTFDVAIDSLSPPTVLKQPEITWTPPADQFVVSGGFIEVNWKRSSESGYRPAFLVDGNLVSATLPPVESGTSIDVRLRSINSIGIKAPAFIALTGYVVGSAATGPDSVDYGSVAVVAGTSVDYGSVAGAAGATVDYGSV